MVVAAPALMMARSATIHSYRVADAIPTRCWGSIPRATRPAARFATRSPTSRQVTDSQWSATG